MPGLLVRAHETDTDAWYLVTTSQPQASAVRRQRRGINAHHRCREEEQLRAASKSANFLKGKDKQQGKRWDGHKDMPGNQLQVEEEGDSCEGRHGKPKTGRKRNAIAHTAPDPHVPVFFA
jgi:hypothetical protein